MRNRILLIAASITSMLFLFSACKDESPSEPATNPTAAAEKVNQANQILIPKLVALSEGDTTALDVSAAAALYAEALSLDANNKDAHFGLAITDILSIGTNSNIRNLFGSLGFLSGPGILQSAASTSLSSYGTLMKDRLFGAFKGPLSHALGKGSSPQADNPPSYYQNIIETSLLPILTSAVNHLTVVLENSTYYFLITPQLTNGATTETYRIDATEINLLKAVLQLGITEASLVTAYNVDYDATSSTAVSQAWQPASAFLAFRTNGSQRMKDARTYFTGAASSIQACLNYLMTEPPNAQTDLINYNPADQSAFQAVIMGLDTVKLILSGPYTPPGGPTINFRNFFDDAIPNYKTMVPSYTVGTQASSTLGYYDAILTWTATSFETWIFPDPTMRGLFPGMTDADLKTWFGMDALDWQQTVIVRGS